jgi:hypothetical protein
MTLLTRRDVLSHQAQVPWASQRQVEQDLLLCRSMAAIFNDRFLHDQVASRSRSLRRSVLLAGSSNRRRAALVTLLPGIQ